MQFIYSYLLSRLQHRSSSFLLCSRHVSCTKSKTAGGISINLDPAQGPISQRVAHGRSLPDTLKNSLMWYMVLKTKKRCPGFGLRAKLSGGGGDERDPNEHCEPPFRDVLPAREGGEAQGGGEDDGE